MSVEVNASSTLEASRKERNEEVGQINTELDTVEESDQYEYLSPEVFQREDIVFGSNPLVDRYAYLTEDDGSLQSLVESFKATLLDKVSNMKQFMDKEREAVVTEMSSEHTQLVKELQEKLSTTEKKLQENTTSLKLQQKYKKNLSLYIAKQRIKQKEHNLLLTIFSRWKLLHHSKNKELYSSLIKLVQRGKLRKLFTRWRYFNKEQQLQKLNQTWESRLKQISRELVNDYENQLREIRNELVESRDHIQRLNDEKKARLNNVKSALMRGVNALNHETLTLFQSET